jgi:hypothetical protein
MYNCINTAIQITFQNLRNQILHIMKTTFLRLALAILFLITAQLAPAQAVITEYFDVKQGINLDFNDKKLVKFIYTAGVLDIDWNVDKRVLSISYDPKVTNITKIMENINNATNVIGFISINNKTWQQYSHTR